VLLLLPSLWLLGAEAAAAPADEAVLATLMLVSSQELVRLAWLPLSLPLSLAALLLPPLLLHAEDFLTKRLYCRFSEPDSACGCTKGLTTRVGCLLLLTKAAGATRTLDCCCCSSSGCGCGSLCGCSCCCRVPLLLLIVPALGLMLR
jgi:hypothetical protein